MALWNASSSGVLAFFRVMAQAASFIMARSTPPILS